MDEQQSRIICVGPCWIGSSPNNQGAFLPGKPTLDNIILAKDVFHNMPQKHKNKSVVDLRSTLGTPPTIKRSIRQVFHTPYCSSNICYLRSSVAWDQCSLPTQLGDLAIRPLTHLNTAALARTVWQFLPRPELSGWKPFLRSILHTITFENSSQN